MKINRFKAIPFLATATFLLSLALQSTSKTIGLLSSTDSKVVVEGALNNAASLAGVSLFGGIFVLFLIGFVTGRTLSWMPKIVFAVIGVITAIAFFIGLGVNVTLKERLYEQGYIECISEREITLKHSSRSYVLPPETCE
ncbi:hypothetical protein RGL42_004999 [Vibrio parahaemolyticus]|nr:hypothetical protein [Vibrio parahaemolyticus]EGQ8886860.1 hypothetical protein [Vibrio parahaemolyticus]EGQ8917812.1 hypothetical protein [Vibrio parahaemolyticus]EGQ8937507.1 hypothetical protein [Vibrio parahaemolyticus]EGR3239899.1 hypothetical protein [Vibrio parahaemolyticus]